MAVMSANSQPPENVFAKRLASNEKKIRDKAVKKLRQWIAMRSGSSPVSNLEMLKIWKGLFYCMYMSDKPLIQEELSENIGGLIHSFNGLHGLEFFRAGLQIISSEWNGIDKWRIDKFLMFLRRLLRHAFEYVAKQGWPEDYTSLLADILDKDVINANKSLISVKIPLSLQVQFTDIIIEELAKAGGEELQHDTVMHFIRPFIECSAHGKDSRLKYSIEQRVFNNLINQSDAGLANQVGLTVEEFKEAVKEMAPRNFRDQAKDPRAGKIDIELPQIHLDYDLLSKEILTYASQPGIHAHNKKYLYQLVAHFKDVAAGIYPLKVVLPEVPSGVTEDDIDNVAMEYLAEQEEYKRKEMEERKNIRKMKEIEKKKATAEEKKKEMQPVDTPKTKKQIKAEKRKMELAEKAAKKTKIDSLSSKVKSDITNKKEAPCKENKTGNEVFQPSSEQVDANKYKKGIQSKPVKAGKTSKDTIPIEITPVQSSNTISKIIESVEQDKQIVKENMDSVPKPDKLLKIFKSRIGIPVVVSGAREAPKKQKIEFSFDDDISPNPEIIFQAIEQAKRQERNDSRASFPKEKIVKDRHIKKDRQKSEKKDIRKKDDIHSKLNKELNTNVDSADMCDSSKEENTIGKIDVQSKADIEETSLSIKDSEKVESVQNLEAQESNLSPIKTSEDKKLAKDPWSKGLEEGELEIIIPNKKYLGKSKLRQETEIKEPLRKISKIPISKAAKVKFVLKNNKCQDPAEYLKAIKTSPGIPHDPRKKPKNGVLKITEELLRPFPSFGKKKKRTARITTNIIKESIIR